MVLRSFVYYYHKKQLSKYLVPGRSLTTKGLWPAICKKIPTFVMVPNFVMVVKFPNSSEIGNGSESPGMVVQFRNSSEIRNGSKIFRNGFDWQ